MLREPLEPAEERYNPGPATRIRDSSALKTLISFYHELSNCGNGQFSFLSEYQSFEGENLHGNIRFLRIITACQKNNLDTVIVCPSSLY